MDEKVITKDLKLPMFSYCMIYYEKFRKVMHWTEKEALTITDYSWWLYHEHVLGEQLYSKVI